MILEQHIPTLMVQTVGDVSSVERSYAEQQLSRLDGVGNEGAIRCISIELRFERGPEWERPALAKATAVVDGRQVRVYADATTMFKAIDALAARLRRRLRSFQHV